MSSNVCNSGHCGDSLDVSDGTVIKSIATRQQHSYFDYIRRKAWLSSGEVARRLDVSLRTVQAWGQRGVLGARYMGDRLRFAAESVEEWVRGKSSGMAFDQADRPAVSQVWDNEEDAKYDRL